MIDLGTAISTLLIVFYIIPGFVGILLGIILGLNIFKKQETNNLNRIIKTTFLALSLAVLLPIICINVEKVFSKYENSRFYKDTLKFEEAVASNFKIESVSLDNGSYNITIDVPKSGDYSMLIYAYQGGTCRSIFTPKYNLGTTYISLKAGLNIISGEVNNKVFSNLNFCNNLYYKDESTIPDGISVGLIDINKSFDIAVSAKNISDDNVLLNNKRNLTVTNPKSVVKDGSIILYSPRLSKNGKCPIYNHINYSTCVSEEKLSVK